MIRKSPNRVFADSLTSEKARNEIQMRNISAAVFATFEKQVGRGRISSFPGSCKHSPGYLNTPAWRSFPQSQLQHLENTDNDSTNMPGIKKVCSSNTLHLRLVVGV